MTINTDCLHKKIKLSSNATYITTNFSNFAIKENQEQWQTLTALLPTRKEYM